MQYRMLLVGALMLALAWGSNVPSAQAAEPLTQTEMAGIVGGAVRYCHECRYDVCCYGPTTCEPWSGVCRKVDAKKAWTCKFVLWAVSCNETSTTADCGDDWMGTQVAGEDPCPESACSSGDACNGPLQGIKTCTS
jgi:hypothetical protein